MFESINTIVNEYQADVLSVGEHALFGFDFGDEMYWMSDIASGKARHIPVSISKDAHKRNKVSLCANLPMFAFVDLNESEVFIVDAQLAKTISAIKITDSKIESVSLSDNGQTILIGGKNGVLSRWSVYNKRLLDIPARHKDFILLSKESEDGRFVVSVGYDRSVMLFDRSRDLIASSIFVATSTIQCARFFADSTMLALGDSVGYIYTIDLATKTITHKFQATFAQILDLHFYKDSYLFYVNHLGVIGVVDFAKEVNILEKLMPHARYKSFGIRGDLLTMCDVKKEVRVYSFSQIIEHGLGLFEQDDMKGAYKFVSEYPFLQSEEFYLRMEANFGADILEARALAFSNNVALAIEKLEPYTEIPSKKDEINILISQIRMVEKFEQLMSSGMEAQAIPMAQKNPLLRELRSYLDFELRFSKVLLLAREFIKNGKKNEANSIMMRYKRIPTKARIVQEVLLYPVQVDEALEAIRNKDYKTYFKLKKTFAFVDSLKGAKELEDDGKILCFMAVEALYALDIKECRRYIEIVKFFKAYRDVAFDLELRLERIESVIKNIS